jgi:hypothetical protein
MWTEPKGHVHAPNRNASKLFAARAPFVSPGAIDVGGELGFHRGFLVKGPDGHVLELVEK